MYLDYFMQTSIKWLPLYKTVKLAHFPAFFITFSSFSEDFAIISARLRAFNSSMVLEFIHTLCFWKSSKKLSQGESNQDLQTQIKCPIFFTSDIQEIVFAKTERFDSQWDTERRLLETIWSWNDVSWVPNRFFCSWSVSTFRYRPLTWHFQIAAILSITIRFFWNLLQLTTLIRRDVRQDPTLIVLTTIKKS